MSSSHQSINLYPDSVHKCVLGDPEYYPEIDTYVESIRDATKGLGTDEDALIETLGSKDIHERYLIAYRYKETHNQDLDDLIRKETSGNFGVLLKLLALPIPDAEAKIINMATKGLGTNEKLLWSVICGRSNEEIELLKKVYFRKYNKDLSILVASELSGALKKLHLACLQAMEETYDPTYHNESKAVEDADAFFAAGEGKWGTDEQVLFDIICKAPATYLQMIDNAYVDKHNHNLERALEKELSGKGKKAAIFHLNMKLNPHQTAAEHIKSTCAGIGTDELGLSCAILRYQHILPRVMVEHVNISGKTIEERVVSETSGYYRKLLVQMIKVGWPDAA